LLGTIKCLSFATARYFYPTMAGLQIQMSKELVRLHM
jgi:hypothetical protein